MKKILVAIDFSQGSIRALKYAIKLANKLEAGILMCWVLKPDSNDSIYNNVDEKLLAEGKNRFDEIIKENKKDLKQGKLEYKIREGKIHVEIANQAKYSDASLIITGTHGISGFEEFWLGSNARRIVTSAPCPVITIRYDFCTKKGISRIVLPIDSSIDSRQKVPFTTDLAALFGAEIHVVGTFTSTSDKKNVARYVEQAVAFINERGVKTVISESKKKPIEIINYARNVDADLIAIMTEQEPSTLSILLGASAEQVVTHSPIPVLSIHPKELYSVTPRL
ncbi:MAG: universal stress protein [Bacteroidales bacterium]|nr:universal stress protein [Bacteroidales bacterium]